MRGPIPRASPDQPPTFRRIGPALLLVVLAPIVAEFLLADFTVRDLGLLVALMPLYGCGALLIRELTRRASGMADHRGARTCVCAAGGSLPHAVVVQPELRASAAARLRIHSCARHVLQL